MSVRSVMRALAESTAAVGSFVLICVALLVWGALHPLPSDAALEARFRDHRAEFDSLRTLIAGESRVSEVTTGMRGMVVAGQEWGVVRRAPDASFGLDADRWSAHRRLMHALRVRTASRGEGGRVSLWAGERGLVTGEVRKGYVWSTGALTPVWSSLDDAVDARAMVAYKPIGDGWWLAVVREEDRE